MARYECTEERFFEDIAEHEMTVMKDDGLYRHLRFSRPNNRNMYFDIVTWPGHLCYTGDMGTYTFARIKDMIWFFNDGRDEDGLKANPSYWSEKVLSDSKYGNGVTEFCEEYFDENIMEWYDNWKYDYMNDLEEDQLEQGLEFVEEQLERVKENVIGCSYDGQQTAYEAAMGFRVEEDWMERRGPNFDDFWEVNCQVFTYHYKWCCFALNWATKKYLTETNGWEDEQCND